METIKLQSHVGQDGVLKLQIPLNIQNRDLEILLVVQPATSEPEALGWSPDFFEKVIGGWVGDPLVRPPQGEFEERAELQ